MLILRAVLTCLLIADDLTGACDAAVHFASRGYRTVVRLGRAGLPAGPIPDVMAVSMESRAMDLDWLRSVYSDAARDLPAREAGILFKKIDSTLRGNAGAEISLATETFACETAVITPAFPAMGRLVEAGYLRVEGGSFAPVGMEQYWREQGLSGCIHVKAAGVQDAIRSGNGFVSADAACDADLDRIVAAGLGSSKRVLWAGSAGIASALARALPRGPLEASAPPEHRPAVLFCLGSDHAVTVEQERALLASRASRVIGAESAEPAEIADVLRRGLHAVLRITYGRVSAERVARVIGAARAPLVLSGGDTATLVWRALGVWETLLCDEIQPGIPRGVIHGGPLDGMPVVTKSGGFGNPASLIRIADYFTCQ